MDEFIRSSDKALQQLMKVEVSPNVMDERMKSEKLEKVVIDADEEKYFQIGVQLPLQERERNC